MRTAANGSEGLGHLKAGPLPRLVLADLIMPVMDGWHFCAEVKGNERLASIPIALISGAWHLRSERTLRSGAAEFLLKPINFKKLLEIVGRYIDGSPAGPPQPARGSAASPAASPSKN